MAQGDDDGQEKTLDPTPQRLEQAREKGDVPKSMDANQAASYLALLVVLLVGAQTVGLGVAEPLSAFLAHPHLLASGVFGPNGAAFTADVFFEAALGASPLILAPLAAVIISLVAQRAIVFSSDKITPKLNRIDPISNAGQKFGPTGLVEFLKNFVKMMAIAVVLAIIVLSQHDGLTEYMAISALALPELLANEAVIIIAAATAIAITIAAIDIPWQIYDHARKLKMSLQDLKDETKRTEGDPHMKQTRQRRGREIATNQMLRDVPQADVVVVNPTHYAVALKWARTPGSAPVCVAKGVDEIARRIREQALDNDVPIHSDPPTARALHATVEIGQEIHEEHYQAVAAAIRFADGLRKQMRSGAA